MAAALICVGLSGVWAQEGTPAARPAEPLLEFRDSLDFSQKRKLQIDQKNHAFERMLGRWHMHATMSRVGTDRSLEYDGVCVGKFLAGGTFFQMETETFLANGQRVNSTSIQIFDAGSETYRMIESLGEKIMVEMVGRVSGDEIIWKPMHGLSYEVAEHVVRFVSDDVFEARTELQELPESPKFVVLTEYKRVKDDVAPGSDPKAKALNPIGPYVPAVAPKPETTPPEVKPK